MSWQNPSRGGGEGSTEIEGRAIAAHAGYIPEFIVPQVKHCIVLSAESK